MTYDAARGEVVMFGGAAKYALDQTWVFENGDWLQRLPATSPPAMHWASMAFDPQSQQLILFGGYFDAEASDETWAWNGTTWTQLHPATSPPPRYNAGLAYDPTRDALVLFGGFPYTTDRLNDTWRWDGQSWVEEDPKRSPAPRGALAMSTLGENVVVFGGDVESGTLSNETWILQEKTWKKVDADPAPSVRAYSELAWDPVLGEAILFGGMNERYTGKKDSWTLTTT